MAAQPTTPKPELHVPGAPGPHRLRVGPLRRPRRVDQHHAADHAEPGCRGHPPRAQPQCSRGRRRRHRGGRPGRRRVLLPGRPRRVLRVPRRAPPRGGRRPRARRRGRRRRHRAHARSPGCARPGVTIFSPEDGQRLGLPGMVNQVIRACDTDLWEAHPTTAAAGAVRRAVGRRPGPDGCRDRSPLRGHACRARAGGIRPAHPGAGHHRHGRFRQVEPHRRARAAPAGGPAGQAAHRLRRDRPDASPGGRCPPR